MAQSPRKKFNMSSEISLALRRYKNQQESGWRIQLDRAIVRIVCQAYRDKFLYVNGTPLDDCPTLPIYTFGELFEYLKVLPVPLKKDIATKKLKGTPLFSGIISIGRTHGNQTVGYKLPMNELLKSYTECENTHKRLETHHPDGIGWNGGILATIECVFDVFNSLLRTNTITSAYGKLFNILMAPKFANLDIQGIFYAFLHMSIRGVASSERIYASGDWRREPVSQQLLFKVSQQFAIGFPPRSLISSYVAETYLHIHSITGELRRLRSPTPHHDLSKLTPNMIYTYAWHWGIYQRFTETNKNRFNAGLYSEITNSLDNLGVCNPTMFSLGSNLAQGVVDNPAVAEVIALLKEMPKQIGDRLDSSVDKMSQKIDQIATHQREGLTEDLEKVAETSAKIHEEKGKAILDEAIRKSEQIGQGLVKNFEPIVDAMNSFKGIIEGIMQQVKEYLSPIPGFSTINLNPKSVFDAISYYIMYINTNSTALKTILALLILNSFGLVRTAYNEIMNFWSWTQDEVICEDGQKFVGNSETSGGMFEWLASSPSAIASVFGGLMASIAKNAPLGAKEFLSLSKKLADQLKNFHFISQGLLGIAKLFDYCKKVYTTIAEWISVHIFRRTPERELLAREVIKLTIKVKYLHTEAGMNAIRMSENVRKQAEQILPKFLGLQSEIKQNPELRHLANDLEKVTRQVKEVSDFVTRLRAISNFQPTMFHIQFVGRPGIGKSTITKNVISDLSKSLWPEEEKPSFYSYNTDLEYFDGYAGQRIMVVDDLYKINDPKHLTASMFLVTNTPVILPMANLNDKGVQLTSEVLLSSTNTAYPLGKDVLCMEAIHRRRHMLVEVICDPDVLDPSLGQFSLSMFKKKYFDKQPNDFPHLTFNLLRPVPQEFGGAATVNADEFEIFREYAQKLKTANMHIAFADRKLDPMFYFSEDNRPPQGINLPATGWNYEQFISNCAVRFSAFRGAEGTYSAQKKYGHVENCLEEIDALLDQRSDIPDAPELPITNSIRRLFCRAQHPYGTTDELGEKIYAGEKLAPELEHIDFDKLVDEILKETNPTGITLTEEQQRTKNLLERKKKSIKDPVMAEALKIEKINGRKYIPITSHFTSWYMPPTVLGENGEIPKLKDVFATMKANVKLLGGTVPINWERVKTESNIITLYSKLMISKTGQDFKDVNTLLRWWFSKEMIYPDKTTFPEELRGKSTEFPIALFKDMVKIGSQWYIDVTSMDVAIGNERPILELCTYDAGPKYKIPADIAYMLSSMASYREFSAQFDNLTSAQQDMLVADAKFRSQYFGSYTYQGIASECDNIFKRTILKTLHYVMSPVRYLAERYPLIVLYAAYFITFFAIGYSLRKLGQLLNPVDNPTSKYLYKGVASNLVYHGRPTSTSSSIQNCTQVANALMDRSVREIIVSDSMAGCKVQCLLTQQYIILNKHVLKHMRDKELMLSLQSTCKDKEYVRYLVTWDNIYQDPTGDLAIIYCRDLPSSRKITQHLITEEEFQSHDYSEELIFLSNSRNGGIIEHHNTVSRVRNLKLKNQQYENVIGEAILVKGHTLGGRSGSTVLTSLQSKPRIIGIQAWEVDIMVNPKIAIQVLTLEKFQELQRNVALTAGAPIERLCEPEFQEVEGYETAAFAYVDPLNLVCKDSQSVGDIGKSQIRSSMVREELELEGITSNAVPAALTRRDRRLYHRGAIHPLAHSLGKYFRGNIEPFKPSILSYAKRSISHYLKHKLDKKTFRTLSIEETITGTREDGSNPMNLKSSPGIPFVFQKREQKGKLDYMRIDEEGYVSYLDIDFVEQYNKFIQTLSLRKLPYTRAYDFPKDELRPYNKALGTDETPPKTRSVTCMNVFYILAWRQLTLDFWASMHRLADGNHPFCPGINPEGPDWNNLYHYLNKHPNAVDFDVSNWDGFLRAELFNTSCDILKDILKFSEQNNNILDAIAFEVMNCYIQYGTIIYYKNRGLVSGFPGTAEINTLSHWLLILYIYLIKTQNTPYNTFAAFTHHVSVAIYGDDIILTFSDEIKQLFNGHTIRDGYLEIGYPVTSASKTTEIPFSKPLLKCTFLKSTWREFLPLYYIRVMDEEVLNNLVIWTRSKQDPAQQFYDNYLDALRIAFGNGPAKFYEFREKVNRALSKANKDIIVYDYLDFERDYLFRYLPNYLSEISYYQISNQGLFSDKPITLD
nr:RNA-dependent RNA polymerase [Lasius niger virus 1]